MIDALLPGLRLFETKRFIDTRGFFQELHNQDRWHESGGPDISFVQDNLAMSHKRGTVRGLHFQAPPAAQAKLISVLMGAIWDVVVDLRIASPTYGRYAAFELSANNGLQLYVPAGFAHGYCTLSDDALVYYKVDAPYAPAFDCGLLWNDPDLGIAWPCGNAPILSDKDKELPRLKNLPAYF